MVESDFFQNICRICANETNGILIFGEKGKESCLEDNIHKFLSIKVSLHDALPKVVCLSCSDKLSEIQTFVSMAQRTQEKLLASLGKPPPTDLTDDDIIDSIEDEDEPSSPCDDARGSLLHSILTNGGLNNTNSEDVTKLEVTLDPMLFLADDMEEDQEEEAPSSPSHSDGEESKRAVSASVMPPLVQLTSRPPPALTQVVRPSSGKAYQCTLCYRGFLSDLGLQNHMWSHLPYPRRLQNNSVPPPEPKKCECGVCGRVYPTMSTLRAHQITHSNLRPHKCNLCDKTFKRNQDLKFHINQHTGERPYRCPYCPKAFASSGNCFSHRKRMHPKQLARDKNKRLQRSNLTDN